MPIISPSSLKDQPMSHTVGTAQQFAGFTFVAPNQLPAHGAAGRPGGAAQPYGHSPTSQASLLAQAQVAALASASAAQQSTAVRAAHAMAYVTQLQGRADATVGAADVDMM